MLRHLRDSVQHPVSLDYFQERLSAGWKLKAIEWEKEVEASSEPAPPPDHAAPYGLEIAPDASRLRHNPHRTHHSDNNEQRDYRRDNAFRHQHGYSRG